VWPKFNEALFIEPRAVMHFIFEETSAKSTHSSCEGASPKKTSQVRHNAAESEQLAEEDAVKTAFSVCFLLFAAVISSTKKAKYLALGFIMLNRT